MERGIFITNLSEFLRASIDWPFAKIAKIEKYVLENSENISEKFQVDDLNCVLQRISFYNGMMYYYIEIVNF